MKAEAAAESSESDDSKDVVLVAAGDLSMLTMALAWKGSFLREKVVAGD